MAAKTERRSSSAPLWVAFCSLALLAGLAWYIKNSPAAEVSLQRSVPAADRRQQPVKVYRPSYHKDDLRLEPETKQSVAQEDPRVFAVNQYLAQLKMVPKGAVAKSCQLADGVATLDFSREFERTYGTEDEQTLLKGILTTMAQFDGVKKVRFTVEGRPLDTLGNVDLSDPQPVIPEKPVSAPEDEQAPPTSGQR